MLEVGARLAECVLAELPAPDGGAGAGKKDERPATGASVGSASEAGAAAAPPAADLELPRAVSAQLPGGLWYTRVALPSVADATPGPEAKAGMPTGAPKAGNGYVGTRGSWCCCC